MAVYAIGDLQGCYSHLRRLLDQIHFEPTQDTLWFCGDLVNRGPESLQTLRFIKSLGKAAICVLGNHDLHLLALFHNAVKLKPDDSLYALMQSPDCAELMQWLRMQPMLHYDEQLHALMVHAGVHPSWDLAKALSLAAELEAVLQGDQCSEYFRHMYGDMPDKWSAQLSGMERWRCITNVFTRMRFFSKQQQLNFAANGGPADHADQGLTPWFELKSAIPADTRVLFGHWSTLKVGDYGRHFALDGGCVWGGNLVALRIDVDRPDWHYLACDG